MLWDALGWVCVQVYGGSGSVYLQKVRGQESEHSEGSARTGFRPSRTIELSSGPTVTQHMQRHVSSVIGTLPLEIVWNLDEDSTRESSIFSGHLTGPFGASGR